MPVSLSRMDRMGQSHNNSELPRAADLPFLWLHPPRATETVGVVIAWLMTAVVASLLAGYLINNSALGAGWLVGGIGLLVFCAWISTLVRRDIRPYLAERRRIRDTRQGIARGEPVAPELLADLALRSVVHCQLAIERLREMESRWGVTLPRIWVIATKVPRRRVSIPATKGLLSTPPAYRTDQDEARGNRTLLRLLVIPPLAAGLVFGVLTLFLNPNGIPAIAGSAVYPIALATILARNGYSSTTIELSDEGILVRALQRSYIRGPKIDQSVPPIPIDLGIDLVILNIDVPAESAPRSAANAARKQDEPSPLPVKCDVWISRAPENVTPVPNPSMQTPTGSDPSPPQAATHGPRWISGGPLLIGPAHPLWHALQAGPAQTETL